MNDIRYALRQFRKSPLFTLIAVITLAVGIGASTAIFTLLDQALIRSLPVSHPEQLVRLRYTGESPGHTNNYGGDDKDFFSYPMYRDLRDKNSVFSGLLANDEKYVGVQWNDRSELAEAELVSGNYFEVLGLQPALGRLLLPADDVPNGNPVVVLSFNYWKMKLGSNPDVIGKALLLNAHPFTIVGVVQPGFHSVVAGETPGLFVPASAKNIITPRWQDFEDRQSHWITIVGRLKPGESLQQAQAGLDPLWHAIRAEELKQFGYHSERTRRLFLDESHIQLLNSARGFSPLRDQIGTPLVILMGMVSLLVLMACVNISSLLLVRAAGRTREMAVRYAMGAGRWQIVRQLLLEGLLLGTVGGALGLLLAPVVGNVLVHTAFTDPMSEIPLSTHPDTRILLFNFAVAFTVSILFSLAPALRFLRPDLVATLKQQSATAAGSPLRFRRISVGAQIAVSLLLLIGAGLFVRTLKNLRAVDVGFVPDHMVTFDLNPRLAGYQAGQMQALNQRILENLAALPGVRAVAATDDPDLAGDDETGNVSIAGVKMNEDDQDFEEPSVTPAYFATLKAPLLAGRVFTDQDVLGKAKVAVVNLSVAKRYFGSPQNAIGHSSLVRFRRQIRYPDYRCSGRHETSFGTRPGSHDGVSRHIAESGTERHHLPGANLAAARGCRDRHTCGHAANRFQTGAQQFANRGAADRQQPVERAADCHAVVQLRRNCRLTRGHRPVRCAGVLHGAAHARDRHPDGDGRSALRCGEDGTAGCAMDLRRQYRGGAAAGSGTGAVIASPTLWSPCRRSRNVVGRNASDRLGGIARSHDSRPPRRIRRTDAGVAYGVEQKTGCTTDSRPAPAGPRLNICRLPRTASWAELSTAASADGSVVLRWLFGFS